MNDLRGSLVLADGTTFDGKWNGIGAPSFGEISCATNMTGYLELLTDPCMAGQLLCFTYPTIGNYGVCLDHARSERVQVHGVIAREICPWPEQFAMQMTLPEYLASQGTPVLEDVDTRALTRHLRHHGTQRAVIVPATMPIEEAMQLLAAPYAPASYPSSAPVHLEGTKGAVMVLNLGDGMSLAQEIHQAGWDVVVCGWSDAEATCAAAQPLGLIVSNGSEEIMPTTEYLNILKRLSSTLPVLALGRGHQLLAMAYGAVVEKLLHPHRGSNLPVKVCGRDEIPITTQNHALVVSRETLPSEWVVTHSDLHDHSIDGMRHSTLPLWSLQYLAKEADRAIDSWIDQLAFWQAVRDRKGAR